MNKLMAALVAGAFAVVPMGSAFAADEKVDCAKVEAKVAECKKGDGKSADCVKATKDAEGCKKADAKPAKKEKKGGC
jgi:hypothetical protein